MVYLAVFVLLIVVSAPAHAYIDAGSGSYMLQMSLAGILAVVYVIKLSWLRIKASVVKLFTGNRRAGAGDGV
jgi:hypothetical protein